MPDEEDVGIQSPEVSKGKSSKMQDRDDNANENMLLSTATPTKLKEDQSPSSQREDNSYLK